MKFNISLLNILTSKTKIKVIGFMLKHEAPMSEREIGSVLKISHMSINRTMPELADINFVRCIRVGRANLWEANKNSYSYKILLKLFKDISAAGSPLDNLKETILQGITSELVRKIIIFGSVANGKEEADSDIDLFLLVENEKNKEKIDLEIEELSNKCYEKYGNRLSPYTLTKDEYNQKKRLKLIAEIEKGIQIYPEGQIK